MYKYEAQQIFLFRSSSLSLKLIKKLKKEESSGQQTVLLSTLGVVGTEFQIFTDVYILTGFTILPTRVAEHDFSQ